jgi:hypothetical protein
MRKKISKSEKIRRVFQQNPTAVAKEVATKHKVDVALVYQIRKKVIGDRNNVVVAHAVSHPSSANQQQVGGSHYKSMPIQPWEAMQAWMTPDEFKGFLKGNAIKYLARCNAKGGLEDVKKAHHYTAKLIEVSK